MIEQIGADIKITRSSELMIGFLWFQDGKFENLPFKEANCGYSLKTNLDPGTYKAKEYDADGNIFDIDGEIVIQ